MKKIVSLTALGLGATFAIASCGGTTSVNVNANRSNSNSSMMNSAGNGVNTVGNTLGNAANSVANAVSSATTSSPESFMKEAAQGGMAEVELGKLASTNAQNAEVKKFGQMMVTDHSKANEELKALAAKKNFQLPTDLGSHQSTLNDLKNKKGADFDEAYVDMMVDDHEDDVSAFEKQAENSSDPEVKAFAAKTLPVLKKHLEAIKAIQAKMSGGGNNAGSNSSMKGNTNHK